MTHARCPSTLRSLLLKHGATWALAAAAALAAGCAPPAGDAGGRLDPSAIDETNLVTLTGNTHPFADAAHAVGALEEDVVLDHMQLVLQRDPALEAELEARIDAMHDPTSSSYHQWLTAEALGEQYGVSTSDLAVVTGWLGAHGFHVDRVPPSRMFIEFTGTVGQVEEAFHTEIDRLSVKGQPHFGNMSDPQIPAELAKVVVGVYALHDFMPHTMHKDRGAVRRDHTTGAWHLQGPSPDFTFGPYAGQCTANNQCASGTCNTATGVCQCTTNSQCTATPTGGAATCNTTTKTCVECQSNADCSGPSTCNTATNTCVQTFLAVTPADFATIYDLNPLFAAGITGTGETVAVIEDTLITNTSDVTTFRTAFGLSGYGGTFTQRTATGSAATCNNSGVNAAEGEAALDAEWAGATAPGAAIVLESCADTSTVFGGLIALENLLAGTIPPSVVSISYGECESENGATANKQYVSTYQQAAAEGVSVFVSSGDEGAASCDADKTVATHGIAVSGFASTPYNVAVGGTDFMDYYDTANGGPALSTYWSATNTSTFGSALGYIPEIPWNDSCASHLVYSTPAVALGAYTQAYGATGFCNSTYGKNFRTTGAGSGGPSNYSSQPAWQTGVVGLPTKEGGTRNLPDVSLFAANGIFGHFLVYCMTDTAQGGGPCTYTNDADALTLAAGGTSFASPSMAGIQALINQKMEAAQGNPNYTFYKLAAAEQGARGSVRCDSSGGTPASPVLPAPECIFHDVTVGDIDVNCTGTNCYGATGSGHNATQGALSTSTTTLAPAYAAGTGWDFATGLGTVDAYNLVNAWSN